jgi:plastocyanin
MCGNFFNKTSLLMAAAVFLVVVGSVPAFAQTPAAAEDCRIEVCYVKMTADGFSPETMTISPGAIVVWKNVDEKVHSLEIIIGETRSEAVIISPGEAYSYRFPADQPREFMYFDAENGKSGQLTVGSVQESAPVDRSKVDFTDARSGISDISMIRGEVT